MNILQIVKNPKEIAKLRKDDIKELLHKILKLVDGKRLLKINSDKVLIIGDLHGDFEALLDYYKIFQNGKYERMIFLGDYVDRGERQIETINFLLVLKLIYKDKVILLKGNHETQEVNFRYGFYEALNDEFLYKNYNKLFELFPLALILDHLLLVHGGISSKIEDIYILNSEAYNKIAQEQEFEELIWNDPDWTNTIKGFRINSRGSYDFGKDVFNKFMEKNKLKLLIRSHQVTEKIALQGYDKCFDGKLISIFSCSKYGFYRVNRKICEISNGIVKII